jgi:hypothetical protein
VRKLLAGVLILACVVVGFFISLRCFDRRQSDANGPSGNGVGESTAPVGAIHTPERSPVFLPTPEYEGLDSNTTLSKCLSSVDKTGVMWRVFPGHTLSMPMVELGFCGLDVDGKQVPFKVHSVTISPWRENRFSHRGEGEIGGSHEVKAHGYRSVAGDENLVGDHVWRFEHSYHLLFFADPRTTGGEAITYESIISIPKKIPAGQTCRIQVLADTRYPILTNKHRQRAPTINGQITVSLPVPSHRLAVNYSLPNSVETSRRSFVSAVRKDGSFSVSTGIAGGELRVTEKNRSGMGWFFVKKVSGHKLSLPRDADLTVDKSKVVTFKVRVPREKVTAGLIGVMLKTTPTAHFGMAWCVTNGGLIRNTLVNSGLVEMSFVPGKWYVSCIYFDEVSSKKRRREELLGTIVVKPGIPGGQLEVTALSNADRKALAAKARAVATLQEATSEERRRLKNRGKKAPEDIRQLYGTISSVRPKGTLTAVYRVDDSVIGWPVNKSGRFCMDIPKGGGQLLIHCAPPSGGAFGWIAVNKVVSSRLDVDNAADVIAKPKDFVSFKLKMPSAVLRERWLSVAILAAKTDQIGLSWAKPDKAASDPHDKEAMLFDMSYVPGSFFVGASYNEGPNGRFANSRMEILGKITITKDSAGKTLEVQKLASR